MVNDFIIFQISTNKAIIDVNNIKEIIVRPDEMTPILDSDIYVEGLINLRGDAIPIIDLRTFLNVPKFREDEKESEQTILIIKKGTERLGIIVDDIYDVDQVEVAEGSENDSKNSLYNVYFPKVVRHKEDFVSIFDTNLIFEDISI
jgi:purine-binding chemotaxis protein CheW